MSRKVFLKHQVNSNRVCGAMQDLPWRNIWPVGNPFEVLNEHLLLLVGRFGPIKVFSFRSSEVKCLLLDLDPFVGSDPLGMFPFFPKTTADVPAPGLSVVFRRLVRLGIVSQLAGDRPISPLFQRVHHPPLLPTNDRFPYHQYCLRCLSVWCRFASDDLWHPVVCFLPHSLLIGKVWVPLMHFFLHISCTGKCIGEWAGG